MRSLKYTALAAALITGLVWQPGMAIAACVDYPSQAQAQEALRDDPTDPEGLDPDGNGIACERFPPPYDREPVVRPNVTPSPAVTPSSRGSVQPEPDEPDETDDGDTDDADEEPEDPSEPEPPTATPAPRSPLLGPVPPPLSALQGGKPIGPLPAVQGGNGGAYPPGVTSSGSIISPPNTGDGGLMR